MRRRGVLTGASDGVDDGVGEDGGVACSNMRGRKWTATVGDARSKAVGGNAVGARHGDGAVGRQLLGRRLAVPTAPLRRDVRRGAARVLSSHVGMAR
jgi:hypothetical protein